MAAKAAHLSPGTCVETAPRQGKGWHGFYVSHHPHGGGAFKTCSVVHPDLGAAISRMIYLLPGRWLVSPKGGGRRAVMWIHVLQETSKHAVLSEQRLPTNASRMSARAQGPQGQGFPSKGSAVINFLIKGGGRTSALAACPAQNTGNTALPSLAPFITFSKSSKCHQIYLHIISPCQRR